MRRLIAALLIWMRIAAPALAQGGPGPIKIVTTCGTQSLTVSGALGLVFYMDHTGNLCTSATGGGGGGSVTQGTTPWVDQPSTQNFVSGTATQTGTTTTSLIASVVSNRIYVTAFSCSNSGASASEIDFQDGSGGTVIWVTQCPAGGGSNLGGNLPLFRTTSGNALYFAPLTASSTVKVSASGFSGP